MAKPATTPATAPAAAATPTPAEQALARIKEAKAAAKAAMRAAKEEASKIDPDYAGPSHGVMAMLYKGERDAFNALAAKQKTSARELARNLLLAAIKAN